MMSTKKMLLILGIISYAFIGTNQSKAAERDVELKVLQFNVWQEGTQVTGGFDAIVDEIVRCSADLVMLSEVRNYNGVNFTLTLVDALKQKGLVYYQHESDDSNLISKYPILSHGYAYELGSDHGSITKSVIDILGTEVALYSAHLDYTHYACYLPRGYSGTTWQELPAPVSDVNEVLQMNSDSERDEQVQSFISDALAEQQQGKVILLGGDFNEPSFKDWTVATKDLFDHNGLVVPWHATTMLTDNGFVDAYRELYPNPVTHPGFTWPADNKDKDLSHLTWTPKSDERDRIDYIFHYPDARLALNNMVILGPKGSIVRNARVQETSDDTFLEPVGVWPSDHKAVLATYTLTTTGVTITRVSTSGSSYDPSETITVEVINGPGNTKDWIGLYPKGAVPARDNPANAFGYVVDGQVVFDNGLNTPGEYEAILMENDGYTILARVGFSINAVAGISVSKSIYGLAEAITVTVMNGPGNAKDWVGLYPKGSIPGNSNPSLDWGYVVNNQVVIAGGLPSVGEYEAILCENDGYNILARVAFSVGTATNMKTINSDQISVYPNPTNGVVTLSQLSGVSSNTVKYTLFSADGQVLQMGVVHKEVKDLVLDLSSCAQGVYFINLTDEMGIEYNLKVKKN